MKPALVPAIILMLAGCAAQADPEPDRYYTVQPMRDFMNNVLQPAAEGVWDRTGYLTDESGFHDLFPQSDADWLAAERASLTVVELSNVLSIPGRRIDEPDWDAAVEAVRITSLAAAEAAAKHDQDAFMEAALALNNACQSCHMKYDATMQERPREE